MKSLNFLNLAPDLNESENWIRNILYCSIISNTHTYIYKKFEKVPPSHRSFSVFFMQHKQLNSISILLIFRSLFYV